MLENTKTEALIYHVSTCASTNYELIKLEAAERSSTIGSGLISALLVGFVGVLFIFFGSLALGFYLSTIIGNAYSGFLIVAGIYLFFVTLLLLARKKLIEEPLRDNIIRKMFTDN